MNTEFRAIDKSRSRQQCTVSGICQPTDFQDRESIVKEMQHLSNKRSGADSIRYKAEANTRQGNQGGGSQGSARSPGWDEAEG